MSTSEENHEVKAIKQRLVVAKLQTTSALKTLEKAKETKKSVKEMFEKMLETLETATKSVDAAQNQYDMLQKDLKDTEKLLVEARERSSSNDIDQKPAATNDTNTNENSSSNKRRKVSVSPQAKTDNQITSDITSSCSSSSCSSSSSSVDSSEESGDSDSSSDECTSVSSSDEEKAIPAALCDNDGNDDTRGIHEETGSNINQINSSVATNWTSTNSNVHTSLVCRPDFKQVTIKDCGLSEFNGIYMLTEYNGQPLYRKRGQSGERAHEIYLVNTSTKRAWVMYRSGESSMYEATAHESLKFPPSGPWTVIGKGVKPPPELSYPCHSQTYHIGNLLK